MGRFKHAIQLGMRDDGQTLVEYALILILVSILGIAALQTIGTSVSGMLSQAADLLS
jgi:Flp pilus assembly pilin Flp